MLSAQDYLFDVQIINVEDGLPDRKVSDITQDKKGFIWISTPGKISRYDGLHFKTYDADFLNIPEYAGVNIAFDEANNLWYCVRSAATKIAYGGILNSKRDSVYNLESFTNNQFSSKEIIYINRSTVNDSEWFMSTRQGKIYKYADGGEFEEIYHYPKTLTNNLIAQQHPNGSYWVMHQNELVYVSNQKAQKVVQLPIENGYPIVVNKIIQQFPSLILRTHQATKGYQYVILNEGNIIPYTPLNYEAEEIIGLFHQTPTYSIFATKEALIIQDTTGTPIYRFEEFEDRAYGDTNIKAHSILLDKQNILWLATDNGLIKIRQQKNPFTQLLPKNSMRGLYLDEDNQLWTGGYKGNIQYNLQSAAKRVFFESSSLGRPPVVGFHKDSQGHLWVGTTEPLLLEYLPAQTTPIEYTSKKLTLLYLPYENPMTKTLWAGTNHGLYQLNKATKQFLPYPLSIPSLNVEIRHFHLNQEGLWVVTSKGLFLIDSTTEKLIKHYTITDGFPTTNFTHLHEDKKGFFWLTSKGGGLIRWDITENKFTQFTQEKGLSNDVIYAVYEDDYNNLWLPSNYGLMCFDKNTLTTQVYLPQNGISHEEFNTFSHFKAADGTLYFGGLNGITSFHPKEVLQKTIHTPPLYITKVSILKENEEEFINITPNFQQTNTISLNPDDRILTLELSLLDYMQSAKNQYAYQIEGYQDSWIYTGDNKISLINLPYGNFTLKLKARGASGSWSKQVLNIPMVVKKPFYLQWWFILLGLVFVITSTIIAVKWRIALLEKDRQRLEEEVKKRTLQIEKDKAVISEQATKLQALDKAKTRFFSNITHEFRTPLTLVIGPLQQMTKFPKKMIPAQQLSGVLKNAQSLLGLINQLLDLSKLEDGKMKLEITHGNIIAYTKSLIEGFESLAQKKQQQLVFLSPLSNWETHFDKNKWDRIIYNLLINAIKFTPQNGFIQICLGNIQQSACQEIYLKVRDNGIGIAEEQLPQVFNRFYQADDSTTRLQEGTGIGLSLVKELIELQEGTIKATSKVGKGTTFEVRLPIPSVNKILPLEKSITPSFVEPSNLIAVSPQINTEELITNQAEKLQLLIIEDNEEMRAYIQSCVPSSAYVIITAINGVDGIKKAQTLIPDLIISDVMMPLKDGFEVTQTIRNHTATSHIPIILLTAKAALESRLEGIKRGADVYLTKPFSPEELTLRIRKLIEIRQLLQARYKKPATTLKASKQKDAFASEDIFITRFRQFIKENLDNSKLNGDLIGKEFQISRMQLHRKLKALTNLSTTEFIQTIRLEMAFKLLQQKELNVSEVAYQTGFNSLTHFTRKFKKKYQITPSEVLK